MLKVTRVRVQLGRVAGVPVRLFSQAQLCYNYGHGRERNSFKGRSSNRPAIFEGGNRLSRSRTFNPRAGSDRSKIHGRRREEHRKVPQGDGLMGKEDYVVDKSVYDTLSLEELIDVSEEDRKFSGVSTEQLGTKKILSRVLVNSLVHHRKYEELTDVQARSLLPILGGSSMVVRAKTGTGKTAAFSIPLLESVFQMKKSGVVGVKGLIISPTRELAQQIADEIDSITSFGPLGRIKTVTMVGGLSKMTQARQGFEGREPADIIVGTPGRLLDMLEEKQYLETFSGLSIKVLDEADRLLDIGFKQDLLEIDRRIKTIHGGKFQTLLFSATTDKSMMDFARYELDGNVQIVDTVPENEPQAQELVSQHATACRNYSEVYFAAAQDILKEFESNSENKFKGIVFLPTIGLVKHFGATLNAFFRENSLKGPRVFTVHGQLSQHQRQSRSDTFRRSDNCILVTTDVVARGMDFPGVTNVFQMSTPGETAAYIHRIGRTARIGNRGKSMLFYLAQESDYLNILSKVNVTMASKQVFDPATAQDVIDGITKVSPEVLDFDERVNAFKSMLNFYTTVQSLYKIQGTTFNRQQTQFGALTGFNDEETDELIDRFGLSNNPKFTRRAPVKRFGKNRNSNSNSQTQRYGGGDRSFRGNNGSKSKRTFW